MTVNILNFGYYDEDLFRPLNLIVVENKILNSKTE